jgi:Protein of unknown function (DUF732)
MFRLILIVATTMVALGIGPASSVAADPNGPDDPDPGTYLFMLRESHISVKSDDDAIAAGLMVCQRIRAGETARLIVEELRNTPSNALTFAQAADIVVAASEQLCPEEPASVWHEAMILAGRNPDVAPPPPPEPPNYPPPGAGPNW